MHSGCEKLYSRYVRSQPKQRTGKEPQPIAKLRYPRVLYFNGRRLVVIYFLISQIILARTNLRMLIRNAGSQTSEAQHQSIPGAWHCSEDSFHQSHSLHAYAGICMQYEPCTNKIRCSWMINMGVKEASRGRGSKAVAGLHMLHAAAHSGTGHLSPKSTCIQYTWAQPCISL